MTALQGVSKKPSRWRRILRASPATLVNPITDVAALESWMMAWVAAKLNLPLATIDRDKPLIDYGLDSLAAVSFSGELEQMIGRPISPSIAWEFPTIAEAAAHVFGGGGGLLDMDA